MQSQPAEAEGTHQLNQPLLHGLAAGSGNHKEDEGFEAPLSVGIRETGNQSREKSLAGRAYSHPLLSCTFWPILVLIWNSFLEILKTAAPLIRAGNVCVTESVKLLHYNKNRRGFDPEN